MTFTPLYWQESDILDSPLLLQMLDCGLRVALGQKVPSDSSVSVLQPLRALSPAAGESHDAISR